MVQFYLCLKSYARWNIKTDKLEMKYQSVPWPCHRHLLFTFLCNKNIKKQISVFPWNLLISMNWHFPGEKKNSSWKFFKQLSTQEMQSRKVAPTSPLWNPQRLLLCSFNSSQKIEPFLNSLLQNYIWKIVLTASLVALCYHNCMYVLY